MVENGEKIKAGKVLVKIPRRSSKSGDITGGLPKLLRLLKLVTLQTSCSFSRWCCFFWKK
jgi:hypothetical protein